MPGLIPRFIVQQFRTGVQSGSFTGSILLFDVSGFTPLTEKLSKMGHQGAEVLSEILNSLYGYRVLKVIRAAGGFVAGFSGDSFTVIVPETDSVKLNSLGAEIMRILTSAGRKQTIPEATGLSFKAGISSGGIEWGIPGKSGRTWFFRGGAVTAANRAASLAGPGDVLQADSECHSKVYTDFPDLSKVRSSRRVEEAFFPEMLTGFRREGEFRRVFSVFISLHSQRFRSSEDFSQVVISVAGKAEQSGGYFNGIHFDEKGPYLLVLFGAPWSFENDSTRAVTFAQELFRETSGMTRIGISVGMVYAGTMGFIRRNTYTVLGKQVNAAARIMRYSTEPGVFAAEDVLNNIRGNADKVSYSRISLKGTIGSKMVAAISPGFLEGQLRRFDKPLVGRKKELHRISVAAIRFQQGHNGGCIVVSGPAGIGKSHLIDEAGNELCEWGCRRIVLQCSDITNLSFEPFRSFLREMFHQKERGHTGENRAEFQLVWVELLKKLESISADSAVSEELNRTVSMLHALLGIAEKNSLYYRLEAKSRYENTILALRGLFTALVWIKPLLMVVEDFHWIDSASAETLSLLSRSPSSLPVLLVLSCRPGDDGSIPSLNLSAENLTHVELKSLEITHLGELVESIIGGEADSSLTSFLQTRTALNPFYIEQFLKYLEETGGIRETGNRWTLVVKPDSIPRGINNILQARLDRLSEGLREVVMTASVLGSEFNMSVLSEMLRGKNVQFLLESGTDVQLWSEVSQMVYVFQHALLRDAAYAMQLHSRLRKMHALAASAIEKLYLDKETFYPDLAYHFERSENIPRAMSYLEKAAAVSRINYNLEEHIGYQNRLLCYLGLAEFQEKERELKVLLSTATTLSILSRWDESIELTEKAEVIAGELGDTRALGEALGSRAWMKTQQGHLSEASQLNNRAIEIFESIEDMEGFAKVLGRNGVICFRKADFSGAESIFLETLDILKNMNNPEETVKYTTNLGCVYKDRGENRKAEQFFERAIEIAREYNMMEVLPVVLGNRGTLFRNQGKFQEAIEDSKMSIVISEQIGDRKTLSSGLGGLALVKYDLGEFHEAAELYRKQLEIAIDLNFSLGEAEAHGYMGSCFEEMKKYDSAEMHYDKCLEISRRIELSYYIGIFLVLKAAMLFTCRRFDEAETLNMEGLDICRNMGLAEMVSTGELLVERLRIARAADPGEIREGLANIRKLLKREKSIDAKAMISHRFWKILNKLSAVIQEEFSFSEVHRCAKKFAKAAFENNPGYSNQEILAELER